MRRLAERLCAARSQHSTLNHQPTPGLERSTDLFRDPANAGRRFIPLLLADCKLPDTQQCGNIENLRRTRDLLLLPQLLAGPVELETEAE